MYACFRTLGTTMGVATCGTVFQNVMSDKLAQLSQPTNIAHGAESFIDELKMCHKDNLTRHAIVQAHGYGL